MTKIDIEILKQVNIIDNDNFSISDHEWSTPDPSPIDDLRDLRNFSKYHNPENDDP